MPANLPPDYYRVEEQFRQAKTAHEKIELLETMLAIMPKHKGTDHLKADLRAKLAKLQEEGERKKGGAARAQLYSVRKEGAGQVALLGPPNAGKSSLVAVLTGASPKVGDYPFTTQLPFPAMMPVDNVQVQLVDLPPLATDLTPNWLRSIARQADILLLVVDLSFDPLADLEVALAELDRMRLEPVGEGEEGVTAEGVLRQQALVVANKADSPDAPDNLELLRLDVGGRLPILPVSAATGLNLEELKRTLFEALHVIRVYTRAPGQPIDRRHPFVLPAGSTVGELAENVHRDLLRNLKYALVWGGSGKFDGQRVSREHVLADEDTVEIVA
ncbi:MAG: GTPase [Chloroflexota bacterium]